MHEIFLHVCYVINKITKLPNLAIITNNWLRNTDLCYEYKTYLLINIWMDIFFKLTPYNFKSMIKENFIGWQYKVHICNHLRTK